MSRASEHVTRILAIDFASFGFGFVIAEGPMELIDWGVRGAGFRAASVEEQLRKIANLIELYSPSLIVLERLDGDAPRRRVRSRTLISSVERYAARGRIAVDFCGREEARRSVQGAGPAIANKHELCRRLAYYFTELAPMAPPKRRLWMTEDSRVSVFQALAMILGCLDRST